MQSKRGQVVVAYIDRKVFYDQVMIGHSCEKEPIRTAFRLRKPTLRLHKARKKAGASRTGRSGGRWEEAGRQCSGQARRGAAHLQTVGVQHKLPQAYAAHGVAVAARTHRTLAWRVSTQLAHCAVFRAAAAAAHHTVLLPSGKSRRSGRDWGKQFSRAAVHRHERQHILCPCGESS